MHELDVALPLVGTAVILAPVVMVPILFRRIISGRLVVVLATMAVRAAHCHECGVQ